jgi:hypothetical protein
MKNIGKLAVLGAALLAAVPFASAATFSVAGSVWEIPAFTNVPVAGSSVYSTTPTATFTLSNTAANNLFNFNSTVAPADYTLSGFLTSGGDTLLYATGASHGGDLLNTPAGCNDGTCQIDSLFQFTGTTTLVNGTTYNFQHDDGLLLYLGSSLVINAGGPTSATSTPFTVCASGCMAVGGTYSFTLDYAEVMGAPAVLITNIPLFTPAPTPEPSSLLLLGTGLVGSAGMFLRRRLAA